MKIKKLLAMIYDMPNAFRVLEIMDEAGCDIKQVDRPGLENSDYWYITTKWYVSEQQAKDLQEICLFKSQYKKRSKLWKKYIFRHYHSWARPRFLWESMEDYDLTDL